MNIKRNVKFSLEQRKKEGNTITENVPIRMRVIYLGKRVDFSTGYRIDKKKWDEKKERVKNGCSNKLKQSASEINSELTKYSLDIQDIFKQYEVKEEIPTPSQLKKEFLLKNKKEKGTELTESISFFDVFASFLKEESQQSNWSVATSKRFRVSQKHLENFDKSVSLENFDEKKLFKYVKFLQEKEFLQNTTIEKEIKLLKWF